MIRVRTSTYALVGFLFVVIGIVTTLKHALGLGLWAALGMFIGLVALAIVTLIIAIRIMLTLRDRNRLRAVAAATGGELVTADDQLTAALRQGADDLKAGLPLVRIPAGDAGDTDVFVFYRGASDFEWWAASLPVTAGAELPVGTDSTKEHFPFTTESLAKHLAPGLVTAELADRLTTGQIRIIRVGNRSVRLRFHAKMGDPARQLHQTRAITRLLASAIARLPCESPH